MLLKLTLLLFGVSLWLPAQTKMTAEQLVSFIKSAIDLQQPDREVASYLKRVTLSERLDDRVIEELQGMGAGARTVEALHALRDATANLPAPLKPPIAAPAPPAPPKPPPSLEEQDRIIKQVREYAISYTDRLPDFLCTQVTRRYVDPTGMEFWHQEDVLTARLSYAERKENYQLILVNNRAVYGSNYEALGGAISSGEFGSMMKEIFEPESQADFHWDHWGKLRGRAAYVFGYRVAQNRSKWHVNYQRTQDIVPGYHGLIYVDQESPAVLRVTLEAELPPTFPLQEVTDTLDYDMATISGHDYMLPLKAVVRMREGKILAKNDVEFRLYRKFSAETEIKFDTPDPLPEDKTKEQPVK
jgi:hypothetical protein